jgi:predicted ATP-grasp superfamily ATP-dependent carboligase
VNEPLAIVGASARAVAQSALRAGFTPVAADLFADVDLRRIASATRITPYPEGFLDWLRTIEPPAWMYTGALENHPELIDQMAWLAPLWGNSGDVLTRVRSPLELAAVLRAEGLLFPETRTSSAGLPQDGSWLAKTYAGASGSGVRALVGWVESRETHQTHHITHFQQRLPGTPCAAVFVAAEGTATLLGLTRQLIGTEWLGAHGFQYAGSVGPLPISETAFAAVKQIGNTLAAQFELIGLFGVDFILAGDEVWTLEVNPRYTASVEVVERITGVRTISAHAAACRQLRTAGCGLRVDEFSQSEIRKPKAEISTFHGKAILFARRDITVAPDFAEWSLAEASRAPWPLLADISPAETLIEAGRPILTLFTDGAALDEVEQKLRRRVAEIEQRLYFQDRPATNEPWS